ncbi:hypothetical protein MBLNU230_g3954t1 [Neophaeotheca triangularis]
MRVPSLFAGLTGLASLVLATKMESLREVPEGWRLIGTPDPTKRIQLRIALHSENEQLFEQTLYRVSDPDNALYGQHLKRDEVKDMLRPSAEASNAVLRWLDEAGISDVVDDGDWINFIAEIQQAEKLLDTAFGVYRHDHKAVDKIRTLHYSLPDQLHQYVDMVQPTTRFGQMRPEMSQVMRVEHMGPAGTGLNVTACNSTITPECLKDLYNVKGYEHFLKGGRGDVGFAAFNNYLMQYPRYDDLEIFLDEYAPYAAGGNFTFTSVAGGLNDQDFNGSAVEANLDVQYLLSIGYPIPIRAYSTAGLGDLVPDLDQPDPADNQNEPYLDTLTYLLAQDDAELPHTLTTSYGEDEQSVPEAYSRRVCRAFGELGARGVSVLFSSGDTGPGSACQTNDGTNTTRFLPIFPASCPYLTSVGGTTGVKPERAVSFSSGGFSDRFARPAYQQTAVPAFLDLLGDRWQGLYNPSGRGFPDVAAQGYNFHVIDNGEEILVGGTSASSPVFAGIIALLNGERAKKGMSGLGFLNPWIYSRGYRGLTDVVDGRSSGCTGTDIYTGLPAPFVPGAGWDATVGWDPVTGLGTPDYLALRGLSLGREGERGYGKKGGKGRGRKGGKGHGKGE